MAGKLKILVGLGAGYVLGARAGRERYDEIAGKAKELWRDPRVQAKAGQAQQVAKDKAEQAQRVVKRKVGDKVDGDGSGSSSGSSAASGTTGAGFGAGSGRSGGTSS